jgi:hypothetical protein
MKRWIVVLLVASCAKTPSRDELCHHAADHLAAVSKETVMPEDDRRRVLASCMTWTEAQLACLLATKDDRDIEACAKAMRR